MTLKINQILSAIETLLSGISTGSGYLTNAGNNVYTNRTSGFDPDNDTLFLNIVVKDVAFNHDFNQVQENMQDIIIQVGAIGKYAGDDTLNAAQDVLTAFSSDETLGGLVYNIVPNGIHGLDNIESGHAIRSVVLTFNYRTSTWGI